jgi:hypothetical protein
MTIPLYTVDSQHDAEPSLFDVRLANLETRRKTSRWVFLTPSEVQKGLNRDVCVSMVSPIANQTATNPSDVLPPVPRRTCHYHVETASRLGGGLEHTCCTWNPIGSVVQVVPLHGDDRKPRPSSAWEARSSAHQAALWLKHLFESRVCSALMYVPREKCRVYGPGPVQLDALGPVKAEGNRSSLTYLGNATQRVPGRC